MDNTIIQVPVTKSFRDEMAQIANNMGFSSLQDLIRFTLVQIKNGVITPTIISKYPFDQLFSKTSIVKIRTTLKKSKTK